MGNMGIDSIGDRSAQQVLLSPPDRARAAESLEQRATQGDPTAMGQLLRTITTAADASAAAGSDDRQAAAARAAAQARAVETVQQRATAGDATAMAQLLRAQSRPAGKGELIDLYDRAEGGGSAIAA